MCENTNIEKPEPINNSQLAELEDRLPIKGVVDPKTKNEISSLFKKITKSCGSIMTIPKGGTTDLFVLTKGLVVIFVANYSKFPINKNFESPFIIVGCHRNEGVFNESKILLDRESEYGSLTIQGDANFLTIDRQSLNKYHHQESLTALRGIHIVKDRLYKNLLDKIKTLNTHVEVEDIQQRICKKYKLDYNEICLALNKNFKKGVIESTDMQEIRDKNAKMFDKTKGNDVFKGALASMTDKERTLLHGTPRIVQRNVLQGLSHQQEQSLFALRQLGTNLKKGQQTTNTITPMSKDDIQKSLKALREEEKEANLDLLQRKQVSDKKLQHPKLEEAEENPQNKQEKSLFKKLNKDQSDLIKIFEEKKTTETTDGTKIEKESNVVQSTELKPGEQKQFEVPQEVHSEFQGRSEVKKLSNNATPKELQIANKRKNLMKLGT